jgi:hypothetical protein
MNMMKLLQEVRGFAEFTGPRPQPRSPNPFILQLRPPNFRPVAVKRQTIRIDMQDLPDIPHPVKIAHLKPNPPLPARLS